MSITLAAEDLCLTQSAVSRQVRTLEDLLGIKLLLRGHRSLAFTTEGERLFRVADTALHQLQEVVGAIRGGLAAKPVTITCAIGVAGLWLLPRLGGFLQRHPNIDVRVLASSQLSNLQAEGIDLAIRYGPPEEAPATAIKLFGETVTPVAHPGLGLSALGSPGELEAQILLEFDDAYRPWLRWDEWLACQGWKGVKPRAVLRFNQYDQIIQAAIASQGIALGRLQLIDRALADGQLTTVALPHPGPLTPNAYWLIPNVPRARSDVDDVINWIREEATNVST